MAYILEIERVCDTCGGDGIAPLAGVDGTTSPVDCWQCGGVGKTVVYTIDLSDIDDKLNNILDKLNDIMEKLNE